MIGSILSNILLVLGMSFVAAGFRSVPLNRPTLVSLTTELASRPLNRFAESTFRVTAAQTMTSLMLLSCATLIIPAAYHSSYKTIVSVGQSAATNAVEGLVTLGKKADEERGLLLLSRGTSIILFLVYIAYLFVGFLL